MIKVGTQIEFQLIWLKVSCKSILIIWGTYSSWSQFIFIEIKRNSWWDFMSSSFGNLNRFSFFWKRFHCRAILCCQYFGLTRTNIFLFLITGKTIQRFSKFVMAKELWSEMMSDVSLKPRPETEKVVAISVVCSVTSWDKLATFRSSIVAMHSIPKIRPFKCLLGKL